MSTTFNTIGGATRSLNVQVAREIAVKILSGELQEESIIPGELVLCEQFGVSRTALREAIKLLSSKGMVESKPKVGTRICNKASWNFLDPQLLGWMEGMETTEDIYLQFLEPRRAIEPHASALAATNASKEQRIQLTAIFQKMCAIAEDFEQSAWVDIDTQFHRTIFISTGNSFYTPFGNVLATVFKWFFQFSSKEGGVCLKEHRAIYEAIMAADPERSYQASLSLMKSHKHRLGKVHVA